MKYRLEHPISYFLLLLSFSLYAQERYSESYWGIGVVSRTASVPYALSENQKGETYDKTVSSFVPLFYYNSTYFFLDGVRGGVKAYENNFLRFSFISSIRFVNISKPLQNSYQLDNIDLGLQSRYKINKNNFINLELMTDSKKKYYAKLGYEGMYRYGGLEIRPSLFARLKDTHFNSSYYALDQETIDAGVDLTSGAEAKYHLISNLYLLLSAQATYFDKPVRDSSVTNKDYEYNLNAGIGFFNNPTEHPVKTLSITPYLRLAHGWATISDVLEIWTGKIKPDPYNNQLTSLFYGHPLADTLFTLPFHIYLTTGFVWHHESEVQNNLQEAVLAIKAYYTIPLPIRFRIGLAEGLSYITGVTYIETEDVVSRGYKPSKLMNYLDYSVDVNLGDLFFTKSMEKVWLGVNVHHRSGVFTYSSQYGRISGGSNYPSVYLQMDF